MSEHTYTHIVQAVVLVVFVLGLMYADPASSQSAEWNLSARPCAITADARDRNRPVLDIADIRVRLGKSPPHFKEALGIYPNTQALTAQFVVLAIVIAGFFYASRAAARVAPDGGKA